MEEDEAHSEDIEEDDINDLSDYDDYWSER